jgi:acetylornithine deacetylase
VRRPTPEPVATAGYATFSVSKDRLEAAATALFELCQVDATSGREAAIVAAAETLVSSMRLPVARMPVAPERDNLVVGHPAAEVLFCTHLDTVPPHLPARREGRVIHGRGSADAKGIVVAMLHALDLLYAERPGAPFGALLVVGEETDHAGARAAAASGLRPRWIVLGEPCGVQPAAGQKGLLKLRLAATGTPGHSAYPEVGVSAVHRLLDTLETLRRSPLPADPLLGETTLNVGQIHGGIAPNVLAPSAEALVLIRCAAPVDAVAAEVHARLPAGVEATELGRAEPLEFETLGLPGAPVPFNTDAHSLAPLGARTILLGPGDMRRAHAPAERLSIDELAAGIRAYADLGMRLL